MLFSELVEVPRTPAATHPATLVRPADVGGAGAWQTMVRDGLLRPVHGDSAVTAATPVTPDVRMAVIAPQVPKNCYVAGVSAVWVHCGGPVPEMLTLAHPIGTNRPQLDSPATVFSGAGLWAESQLLGVDTKRGRVTTLLRTCLDLALREDPDVAKQKIRTLQSVGLDLRGAARALEFRGHTIRRPRARRILAELLTEHPAATSRPLTQ